MTQQVSIEDLELPSRPADGHKGTFGRVLVMGGSVGMSGSVCLTATAALRSGAGLVTVAVPRSIQAIVAGFEPSYMTIGLACDEDGMLEYQRTEELAEHLENKTGVAIGPGLGQSRHAADLVLSVLQQGICPVVMDADALNLAAEYEVLGHVRQDRPCVITPHPGEFARLTGRTVDDVNQHRESLAVRFARENNVVVVLKGAGTVVTDGDRVYVNGTGNSGMATGGSGDALTGVVVSLLAQGQQAFAAAALAVHVHGMAGDLAAAELSERGLIASDLLRFLPAAWRNFQNQRLN
ncbi:MAG: NAD(P)H-hydrate dehydratase [Fuerstiella sp.]